MKKLLALPLLFAGLLLSGCGKNEPAASAPAAGVFELTANDAMKYNLNRIEAKPGQEIKVILTNIGTMPKVAMAHNFVLLKKGVDAQAFVNAAVAAQPTDYIPPAMAGDVIAHTKLLGPKQTDEITIKVPTEPGEYAFLCSFPAHYQTGMKGVLVVQ